MTTTTEASDICRSVTSIYEVLVQMEAGIFMEDDLPTEVPYHVVETIQIGCVSILTGISFITSIADQVWFSEQEQATLELAHEYARWRLETLQNEQQQ